MGRFTIGRIQSTPREGLGLICGELREVESKVVATIACGGALAFAVAISLASVM